MSEINEENILVEEKLYYAELETHSVKEAEVELSRK